jgi:hypothetical protein
VDLIGNDCKLILRLFLFYFIGGDALGDGGFSFREIRGLQELLLGIFWLAKGAGIGDCESFTLHTKYCA